MSTSRLSARQETLKSLDRLPAMSSTITQLLAKLARRNCDIGDVSDLVERDAVLAGQVLKLANSAVFGRVQPVITVRHAIALVGIGTMRKFALANSVANLFSRFRMSSTFSMMRFNLHSVAVGTLTELMVDELPVEFPKGAFIAGLLHDVGKLLIAVSMPRQYESILAMCAVSHQSHIECEREMLGTDHAELSGLAISKWKLPDPVQWAASYHHDLDKSSAVERPSPGKLGLSVVVNRADAFINHLGMSVLPSSPMEQEAPSMEIEGFPYNVDRVLKGFSAEWKTMGDVFG